MPTENLPDVRIKLNGVDQGMGLSADLVAVTVQEDLDAISTFAIEVYNWDQDALRVTWSDDAEVVPGVAVDITLGYVDDLTPVLSGEVTSIEPSFVQGELYQVRIRGFDHGHRLQRGRHTRTFVKQTDRDIVGHIGREAGLKVQAAKTGVTHDYVIQHNQTDWAFLRERAGQIGFNLLVRDKTLHYGPPDPHRQPVTLTLSDEVKAFRPRLSNRLLADKVVVSSWDPQGKKVVTGRAQAGQERLIGGRKGGLKEGRSAFGSATLADVDSGARSPADAEKRAAGRLEVEARHYVVGEAVCKGQPKLHPGDLVSIDGAGERFSGPYHVTGVTHTLDLHRGFETRLSIERSAI